MTGAGVWFDTVERGRERWTWAGEAVLDGELGGSSFLANGDKSGVVEAAWVSGASFWFDILLFLSLLNNYFSKSNLNLENEQ